MKFLTAIGLTLLFCISLITQAATVLVYHHVSSDTPASTSVSIDTFKQHLDLIEQLNLNVVPLTTITNAIKNKESVDDNWIALTFDDGYKSVYTNAYPLLKEKNYSFTVFVNPDMVKPSKLYMDWQQLEELSNQGVIIANHTLSHENLVRGGLSAQQIIDNITQAEQKIKTRLNQNHKMLAYPYGEYDAQVKAQLNTLGYIGFAQHSGAINESSDITALTRFPANGIYANPKTLKNKMNSIPFDFLEVIPSDTTPNSKHPLLQVQLKEKDFYQSQLACFITGSYKPQKPEWTSKLSFKISANDVIPSGRVKYNCTAPSIKNKGRFYWMSKLWIN